MDFELKDLLEAIGPNATLIFAAWIFLSFLQQRYTAAYDRYRALVEQYRGNADSTTRHRNVKGQVLLYKRRCEQMKLATNIGVVSAMLLITALISAGLSVIFEDAGFLKYVVAVASIVGLVLVMCSAGFVLVENSLVQRAIDNDPSDIEDLGDAGRHSSGSEAMEQGQKPADGQAALS
jgi:hypothetical protein